MPRKISKKYNKYAYRAVVLLALTFFIGVSLFNTKTQDKDFVKWASPDESSNYIFTRLYAETGKIKLFEKFNVSGEDILHPRSMRSDSGIIKPVSFLGIILIYGKIATVFGSRIIPYLTPLFAAIGIVYFYLFIKILFGRTNALLSALLLASFPPYIYYSARSMFHNVLFTVLLLIGLYYLVLMQSKYKNALKPVKFKLSDKNKKNRTEYKKKFELGKLAVDWCSLVYSFLGGLFLGLTVITRTSELIWLIPAFLIILLFNVKKVNIVNIAIVVFGLSLALIPALCQNKILYGGFLSSGYPEMNQSLSNIANAGSDIAVATARGEFGFYGDIFKKIKNSIFHFGFHPRQSLRMFYNYFIKMFPWIFWPGIFGLIWYALKTKKKKMKFKERYIIYLFSYFIVSSILILYYGSWEFHDNPDPNQYTIGNSYTRYWLPVYLGVLPFAALFIMRISRIIGAMVGGVKNKKTYRNLLRATIIFIIYFASLRFVLWNSSESLFYLAGRQKAQKAEWTRIIELTENDSAIITRYHDKLLFPERKVIVGLFDDTDMVARYAKLAKLLPLYYYNFTLPETDIEYLNTRRLFEAGLSIEKVEQVTKDFTLYKLQIMEDE